MDEAGTESVNVVTEIGQERDRSRNMKGNIIQEINFPEPPKKYWTRTRWPEEETGRNSVKPCKTASRQASKYPMAHASDRETSDKRGSF